MRHEKSPRRLVVADIKRKKRYNGISPSELQANNGVKTMNVKGRNGISEALSIEDSNPVKYTS